MEMSSTARCYLIHQCSKKVELGWRMCSCRFGKLFAFISRCQMLWPHCCCTSFLYWSFLFVLCYNHINCFTVSSGDRVSPENKVLTEDKNASWLYIYIYVYTFSYLLTRDSMKYVYKRSNEVSVALF